MSKAAAAGLGQAGRALLPFSTPPHRRAGRTHPRGTLAVLCAEFNPVECIWSYWKQHELASICPEDYWQFDDVARNALPRTRCRGIGAFARQSASDLVQRCAN